MQDAPRVRKQQMHRVYVEKVCMCRRHSQHVQPSQPCVVGMAENTLMETRANPTAEKLGARICKAGKATANMILDDKYS